MDMSLFEKIVVVFKNMFSSFISIEILLIILLFFGLLFLNLKGDNKYYKYYKYGSFIIFALFFVGLFIAYFKYVGKCATELIKVLLNLLYFPNIAVYFTYVLLVTVFLIYILISKKVNIIIKRITIIVTGILYLFYSNVIALIGYNNIDVFDKASVYSNDIVLSFIQISDLILLIWIIFIIGYLLFLLFRREDKEET